MKYFAVFSTMRDEEKNKTYRPDHLDFLAKMRSERKIFMNGRFADGAGGLVIYKGRNIEQVEAMVKEDPYVYHGARNYEIHEWEMETDVDFKEKG